MSTDQLPDFYKIATAWSDPVRGEACLAAIAIWIVGRRLIRLTEALVKRGLER